MSTATEAMVMLSYRLMMFRGCWYSLGWFIF